MGHSWQEWVFINESNSVIWVQGWKLFGSPWRTGAHRVQVQWGLPQSALMYRNPGALRCPTLVDWGTVYLVTEVQCTWYTLVYWGTSSSGAVRGRSVSHANLRPVTALHYTSHYTSPRNIVLQHRPEIRRVVLHLQVECKAPLNSAENWNVHFSKKEIRHCPAGEPAGFS